MNKIIYPAAARGHANHGWLNAYHSFSFASYHDPAKTNFGLLRVLNDDTVAPKMGFSSHPHDNMEIVTIPLSGALKHKDNTGREAVIAKGEVQIMSAGKGIVHSEVNASETEPLSLFQIWVFPKLHNIEARYEQKIFSLADRKNKWQTVVSPDEAEGGVWINQDARFVLGDFEKGMSFDYSLKFAENGCYLMVVEGEIAIEGETLKKRDAIGLWNLEKLSGTVTQDAELLLLEVPMR